MSLLGYDPRSSPLQPPKVGDRPHHIYIHKKRDHVRLETSYFLPHDLEVNMDTLNLIVGKHIEFYPLEQVAKSKFGNLIINIVFLANI
jgi:hypothetical protein